MDEFINEYRNYISQLPFADEKPELVALLLSNNNQILTHKFNLILETFTKVTNHLIITPNTKPD